MSYYSTPYFAIQCYITPCYIRFLMTFVLILVTLLTFANSSANTIPNHVHGDNSVDAMVVSISILTFTINSDIDSAGCTI